MPSAALFKSDRDSTSTFISWSQKEPVQGSTLSFFLQLLENKVNLNQQGMKLRSLTRNTGKDQNSLNFAGKSCTSFDQDGEAQIELKAKLPNSLMLCLVEPHII